MAGKNNLNGNAVIKPKFQCKIYLFFELDDKYSIL